MANRLAAEHSPYLLQHKDNPVDWYPWGDEALARARDEDRPIMNESGTTIVVVEQNATLALRAAKHAYVLETGRVVLGGLAADLQENESVRRSYLGY